MKINDYEKKEKAKQVNLISFLQKEYPDKIYFDKDKRDWRIVDSNIKVTESSFYDFDTGSGGDNIRFLTDILKLSFFKAVNLLLDTDIKLVPDVKFEVKADNSKFEKPKISCNTEKIYRYLQGRGVDNNITKFFIDNKLLYLDTYNNLVFANDEDEFYIIRSTYSNFKRTQTKEPYQYWYFEIGTSNNIYIFEAPVDAISFYQLYKKDGIYIVMAGLKVELLKKVENKYNSNEYKYHLCVDWDNAGNEFCNNHTDIDRIKGTHGKDWNDELINTCLHSKNEKINEKQTIDNFGIPKYNLFD